MSQETIYDILYLEINAFALVLLLIVRIRTLGISKMVAQRNFSMALDSEFLCILSDALCVLASRGILPHSPVLLLGLKTLYFFTTTLMCFFWFLYFEHMQHARFVEDRRRVALSTGLVWVMGTLLLANWFTGFLFSVDADGAYHRGPLFALQYLLAYAYVFFTCGRALIRSFQKAYLGERHLLRMLALFPVGPALAGMVQFVFPQLPLACAALALETLLLYLTWVDQMISIDPLTHLNNRKQLAYSFDQWAHGDSAVPLTLFMVDANKFKGINDQYGHLQGDAALVRIAEALRRACAAMRHRTVIARYGGDEFVVLTWEEDPQALAELDARIREILARLNREADAPYELSVCIGAARSTPGCTLAQLIQQADEALYEEKSKVSSPRR